MGGLMGAVLSVDESRCTGHGRCYTEAPKLLSDDDEGFVTLRGSSMEISDDDGLLADAQKAVIACPERAITLTRTT